MREARRYQQLFAVLEAQLGAVPLPIGRRSLTDINCHIKKRPTPAAHQLVLRVGRCLEMEPANGALGHGQGVIVLQELRDNPMLGKRFEAVTF